MQCIIILSILVDKPGCISFFGALLLGSGLCFRLEPGLLLLRLAEHDFFLKARELPIYFLDEFGGQVQVLVVRQQRLHVAHLSHHCVELQGPVGGREGRLLLLLLFLRLLLLRWCLLALVFGIKHLHLGVFTFGIVKKHLEDLSGLNVATHLLTDLLSPLSVGVGDICVLCLLDQVLDLLNRLVVTLVDLEALHLEAEVPLSNESLSAPVDLAQQPVVQVHIQLLGRLDLVVERLHRLEDRLVVVDVVHTPDEVADVQLLLQLQVQHLGLVTQLHCDINVVIKDVLEYFVNGVELHGGHGVPEVLLLVRDALSAHVAATHRPLLVLVSDRLEHPNRLRALDAEELFAGLAVVANVLEVEFAVTTFLISTVLGGSRLLDQLLHLGLCRQVERGVATRVLDLDVDSSGEEALEDLLGARSCCLMHCGVAVHVDVQGTHVLFKQDPNHLVMTFV